MATSQPLPAGPAPAPAGSIHLKASSPGDLLALVPYLLGFRPHESLVILLLGGGHVRLTARLDLPPVTMVGEVAARFADLRQAQTATQLVLIAYSAESDAARALLGALVAPLQPLGLVDAFYVSQDRWWSTMCSGRCCPAGGTPYDPLSHPLTAEAVYAGLVAADSREAVRALVTGPSAEDVEGLSRHHREAADELDSVSRRRRAREMAGAVTAFVASPGPLDDADCARLAVLAGDIEVRDVAWLAMRQESIEDHVNLWGQVVARAVAPWEAAPLCLLGMAAWIAGNGALQNCCSERARRLHPGYSMAGLLEQISRTALPPTAWVTLAADLRAELGPLAGAAGRALG